MAGSKRPGEDDVGNGGSATKHQRLDGPVDQSNSAKKKSAGATRTGQACDRCKVRKIRCDARPGGCSPCLQNSTECRTTDRITGRATSRGHTENIENENATLRMYMVELQQQLRDNGVEPKAAPTVPLGYMSMGGGSVSYWGQMQSPAWGQNGLLSTPTRDERKGSQGSLLPDFRPGCIGDNYLGVSSENNWLSPIEGTSLALFGTKIDLAEFMPPDSDPASSAMSYRTFLNLAFGKTKPVAPAMPAYEQCKVFAEWYFRSVQIFIPILHRPDFMRLLERIHKENYAPSPAETVMVHMMLAVLNFQFSARNANEQARLESMSHYHYALSFIPDLITGHKLEDIQALTLICSQLRNQPRPAAAWMFTNTVMGIAIESGLHRSAKAWQDSGVAQDPHRLEMRKRIFWSLLLFHVHISGKLGRPMPLRLDDFDIEFPESIADNLPEEYNANKWKNCSFRAGIEGFKLLRIMHQVYATIYSIKSTGQYEMNVRQLGKELEAFQAQLPVELRGGPQSKEDDQVAALYLDMSVAECQLLLHHPSLCRSPSPQLMNDNLDVCLNWSSRLLSSATQLKELKSLDTSWFYSTDFLAAIFTTLFAYTERRDQMNSEHLQRLREDMQQWVEIMGEIGVLLGSGPSLQNATRNIVDFSLNHISRHLAAKTASAAVASTSSPTGDQNQSQPLYNNATPYNENFVNGTSNSSTSNTQTQTFQDHQPPPPPPPPPAPAAFPTGNQFSYSDPQNNGVPPYNADNMSAFNSTNYSGAEESKSSIEAQLASMTQPTVPNFLAAFPPTNPTTAAAGFQPGSHAPGQSAWRNFADAMMTGVGGPEYMTSAGALMALSGGKPGREGANVEMAANMGDLGIGAAPAPGTTGDGTTQAPWPLMLYDNPNTTGAPH